MGIMVRLGIWQLDRLKEREALNALIAVQVNAPRLDLNTYLLSRADPAGLTGMQYRQVSARGEFDATQAVALRNQIWLNEAGQKQLGAHLITPFHLSGSDRSILVDLGWIPQEAVDSGKLRQYVPSGEVTIQGVIQISQNHASIGIRTDPPADGTRLVAFYSANVARIGAQIPYPLLPVLFQQEPSEVVQGPPYPQALEADLSNGPHLSYAIQWFSFTMVLGAGYLIYFLKKESK
jgi:surfeit locus 1 family protein